MYQLGHTDDEQEAYRERLAELDEAEFPEEEEEEEEEDEGDAKERMRGTLVEKFEEQTEVISTVQVRSLGAVCAQYACMDLHQTVNIHCPLIPVTPVQLMRPGYW